MHLVSELDGSRTAQLGCTQLPNATVKEARKIREDWVSYLRDNPTAFENLWFVSRVPQDLFDAICCQTDLEFLYLKWGAYKDLSALRNLKKLKFLRIGTGASVQDISALGDMPSLQVLSLENFQKISDYSVLGKLTGLLELEVGGKQFAETYIPVDDLEFLRTMKSLRALTLINLRLASHSYLPICDLVSLERLALPWNRDVDRDQDVISAMLPNVLPFRGSK
jgi:hypothetical protein